MLDRIEVKCLVGAAALIALAGCGTILPPAQGTLFERDGVSVFSIPEGLRETYFADPKSFERHCRAPSPDVSITSSEGVSFSGLPIGGTGGGVGEDSAQGAVTLGGRDPAVLITRELMYRACELANNLKLSEKETLKLYRDTLDAIVKISGAQTGAGSASQTAAPPAAPNVPAPTSTSGATSTSTSTDTSTSTSSGSSTDTSTTSPGGS